MDNRSFFVIEVSVDGIANFVIAVVHGEVQSEVDIEINTDVIVVLASESRILKIVSAFTKYSKAETNRYVVELL